MTAVERLGAAIGYPDPVRPGAERFDFIVDGATVSATAVGGRLVLSRVLANADELGEGQLERLAGYAAGRVLKEEATLSWDPDANALILWQDVSEACEPAQMRLFFDVFCASCDWWAARIAEGDVRSGKIPEMVFLP